MPYSSALESAAAAAAAAGGTRQLKTNRGEKIDSASVACPETHKYDADVDV